MKLRSIVQSQATRFVKVLMTHGAPYIPDALQQVHHRYGFVDTPKNLEQFDATKGMTFSHGKFRPNGADETGIVINRFQIYEEGFLAETRSTVEDADAFLDDFLSWSSVQFGLKLLDYPPMRALYNSQIEVQSELDLEALLATIQPVGNMISRFLAGYDRVLPAFAPVGFSLHCGAPEAATQSTFPIPSLFTFERLARYPHSTNIFISSAPLKTADHLALIKDLEGGWRTRRSS